jgi:hypothetical protein
MDRLGGISMTSRGSSEAVYAVENRSRFLRVVPQLTFTAEERYQENEIPTVDDSIAFCTYTSDR